jgi:hypothetical protein
MINATHAAAGPARLMEEEGIGYFMTPPPGPTPAASRAAAEGTGSGDAAATAWPALDPRTAGYLTHHAEAYGNVTAPQRGAP